MSTVKKPKTGGKRAPGWALEEARRIFADPNAVLRAMLLTTSDGYWLIDGQARMVGVNDVACAMLGYSQEEMLTLTVQDIEAVETQEETASHLRTVIERGYDRFTSQHRRKDGHIIDVEVSVHRLAGPEDGMLATLRDITDSIQLHRELEEREAHFRALFELSTVGKSLTAPDGRLLEINVQFADMLGYTTEEMSKLNFADVTYPDDLPISRESIRCLLAGERDVFRFEKRYIHRDGHLVWTMVSTRLMRDDAGSPRFFVTSIQDISDIKATTRALEESNRDLENFAYVASHDLQEPLRKVEAFGQLLKTQFAEVLPEKAQDYIARMQAAAGRMRSLVDGLLTLSRVNTRELKLVRVPLESVVREAWADLELRVRESSATLRASSLPTVIGDAAQLRQLFQNLLDNALKFSRDGVPPEIDVRATALTGRWDVSVSDNGIGFDEKYRDKLFVIFQRLQQRDAYPGHGIGLAVCRRIMERHKGTIAVESVREQGTTFTLSFPKGGRRQE